MKSLIKSGRILALEILLLVSILDVLLWRTASPFVSETHVDPVALVITSWAVAVSLLLIILKVNYWVWPAVWAAVGALFGTIQTVVTFSGSGGFHIFDGNVEYISEAAQKPLPGPAYALIGLVAGLLLCYVAYKIRDAIVETRAS